MAEKITTHTGTIQAIILTPTRELAIQVAQEIRSFVSDRSIKVVTIYGGQSYGIQKKALRKGADIVVGTPGRIIDHISKGFMKLHNVSYFVLDEADEMLNMGFVEDIKRILKETPQDRTMLFFSATMPPAIMDIAKLYMIDYEVVSVKNEQMTTSQTDQMYFEVHHRDRFEALTRIIDIEPDFFGIIFCRTKVEVEKVTHMLQQRNYDVDYLHGDVEQRSRERILRRFKKKELIALVATDVAARGIDVNDVTHVINYSLPQDPESYVHRVGRTGRAGKEGTAITFVTPQEYRRLLLFKRVTKTDITKAEIPKAQQIVDAKKKALNDEIETMIATGGYKDYTDFAKELLTENTPDQVVASLLAHAYEQDLSLDTYTPLQEVSIDKTGTARMFVALGKTKGYTIKKLVDFIAEEANVDPKCIKNVTLLDDFSFITAPFEQAEAIMHTFAQQSKGRKPLVTKAKERGGKRKSGGRNRRGGKSRGGRRRR